MMWPKARQHAEAFATALRTSQSPDAELQRLAQLANGLRDTAVDPSPQFLSGLRGQLMTEAAQVLVATPRAAPVVATASRRRKRLSAVVIAAITIAGMLGITTTSAQALPGDLLYPVKRGMESVQLALQRSDVGRGAFELEQASERLQEAQSLAASSSSRRGELMADSLSEFADKAAAGSQSLFADFADGGDRASINKVAAFATRSHAKLAALSDRLPDDAVPAFRTAASAINSLVRQASTLCDECDSSELPDLAKKVQSTAGAATPKPPAKATPAPSRAGTPSPTTATVAPPTRKPVVIQPPPTTLPPPPIDLGDATKPVVGSLLGDDGQTGLIPELLDGLAPSNGLLPKKLP